MHFVVSVFPVCTVCRISSLGEFREVSEAKRSGTCLRLFDVVIGFVIGPEQFQSWCFYVRAGPEHFVGVLMCRMLKVVVSVLAPNILCAGSCTQDLGGRCRARKAQKQLWELLIWKRFRHVV